MFVLQTLVLYECEKHPREEDWEEVIYWSWWIDGDIGGGGGGDHSHGDIGGDLVIMIREGLSCIF